MKLYHTLPTEYFDSQMRENGFYSYWDQKYPDGDITLGIWCCDNLQSSWNAGQHKSKPNTILSIDATDMLVDNQGDFLKKNNGDYYLLREAVIPKNRISVEFQESVENQLTTQV